MPEINASQRFMLEAGLMFPSLSAVLSLSFRRVDRKHQWISLQTFVKNLSRAIHDVTIN